MHLKKAVILSMIQLPEDFVQRVRHDPYLNEDLLIALDQTAPTSVRLHPKRKTNFQNTSPVAWNSEGIYLESRPSFTYDPLFHAGAYYPQEAGSMYLQKVLETLDLPENPVVLDLSAAPGGKSTLIAAFLDHRGVLLANEINRSRAYILSENLSKWGYANTFVCNHKPAELKALAGQIDVLLVDAPCSGEGMFRKDPQARNEWSTTNAQICVDRQQDILADVWPLIKEGGYLIYSTCTFNPAENEQQLTTLLSQQEAQVHRLPYFEGLRIDRAELGYYFLPNQLKSEGFYISALQKSAGKTQKNKPSKNSIQCVLPPELNEHLALFQALHFWQKDEQLHASTPFALDFFQQHQQLRYLKTGTHIATKHKKSWTPGYDMVYSLALKWNLPEKVVELDEALRILHGESQQWDAPAGFYRVTYQEQAIAMIKQIGQRFNNLHPNEWRIRHLPK